MTHPLQIAAHGELEIVLTRVFDAPRHLVFDAWTKPELLQQWLGVRGGWTMPICEIDLRVGGNYRWVWRNADGAEMGVGGEYREIVVPERLVSTERYDDAWYPGEALNTLVLEASGDQTISKLAVRYESLEARDLVLASPMESGVGESYEVLDGLLSAVPSGIGALQ